MCHPGELHVNGRNRHGWYTGDWLPYWFSSLWMRFLPSALTAGQDLPSSLWPFLTFGVKSNNPEWSLAAAKSRQSCPTLCDPIDGSPLGSHPWDSPGKNTGVGCHFLLQFVKVKSKSAVAQSCPTLRNPMDCSPPACSVHQISQARVLQWVATAFSESYII